MNLGLSVIDITPAAGGELSGFASRIQPSVAVLDPLFAKALYLVDGDQKLLWIHCDLVGLDRSIVLTFREWAIANLHLTGPQVMISATHTHSGPCTIHLEGAGRYDASYVALLLSHLKEVAVRAASRTEKVELVSVEGHLNLAVDRRKTVSSHTDPRVGAIGFRGKDRNFLAVVVNYAMHAVALGASNRLISADVPGQAANALTQELPGSPVVLFTSGASGNLNPPDEDVSFAQVKLWGKQIADSITPLLKSAKAQPTSNLIVKTRIVPLPLDVLDVQGINAFAEKALMEDAPLAQWGDKYRRVVEHWRNSLLTQAKQGHYEGQRDAELFCVCLGSFLILGANAEVFSEFTDWLRLYSDKNVYLIGYANGDMGYLPTRAAYREGGYEVNVAHLFYGGFRPKAGGLEKLRDEATKILRYL